MRRRVPPEPPCCPYGEWSIWRGVLRWRLAWEDAEERGRVLAEACPHVRGAIEEWQARTGWRVA